MPHLLCHLSSALLNEFSCSGSLLRELKLCKHTTAASSDMGEIGGKQTRLMVMLNSCFGDSYMHGYPSSLRGLFLGVFDKMAASIIRRLNNKWIIKKFQLKLNQTKVKIESSSLFMQASFLNVTTFFDRKRPLKLQFSCSVIFRRQEWLTA